MQVLYRHSSRENDPPDFLSYYLREKMDLLFLISQTS